MSLFEICMRTTKKNLRETIRGHANLKARDHATAIGEVFTVNSLALELSKAKQMNTTQPFLSVMAMLMFSQTA